MKQCIQNNYNKVTLTTILLYKIGGKEVYTNILSNLLSNFKLDDTSQFLTYLIDRSAIEDKALRLQMNEVRAHLINVGARQGYESEDVMAGFTEAAVIINKQKETPLITNVLSATDDSKATSMQATDDQENTTTPEIEPAHSRITKLGDEVVHNLTNIQEHYLPDKLSEKLPVLDNTFKKLISRNWLSTFEDKKLSDNFDFKVISENIKKDAHDTILNYYKNIADATSTYTSQIRNGDLLFFTDAKRIHGDAKLMHTSANGTRFFISEYTPNAIFVVTAKEKLNINTDFDTDGLDNIAGDMIQETPLIISNIAALDPDVKPANVSLESAEADIDNEALLTTYAAFIILNEFNSLINANAKELSDMYKEIVRDGPIRIDMMSSAAQMTRFTKLGLMSTPQIHESSTGAQTLRNISNISQEMNSSRKSAIEHLNDLELIKGINGREDKIFTFNSETGTDTNMIINIGITNVAFTHTTIIRQGTPLTLWTVNFPNAINGEREFYTNIGELKKGRNPALNSDLTVGINKVLDLLNDTDLDTIFTSKLTVATLDETAALKFINNTNSTESMYSNADTFSVSTFRGNASDRFINPLHVTAAANILTEMPHDIEKAGDHLLLKSKRRGHEANVARALYYKYFHKGEYRITEVNQITGLLETTTHMSIYEKARRYEDPTSWMALIALMSQLTSTVTDNKVFLSNNYLTRSSVENSNNINFLISSIDNENMQEINSAHVLPDETLKKYFKVNTSSTHLMTIDYYRHGFEKQGISDPELTTSFTLINSEVKVLKGDFTFPVINEILTLLKAPRALRDVNLYDALRLVMSEGTRADRQKSLNNFYGTLIALRLGNAADSNNVPTYPGTSLRPAQGKAFKYGFKENLVDYRDELEKALSTTFSRTYSAVYTGPTGVNFSNHVFKNLSKKKKAFVEKVIKEYIRTDDMTSLLKNSALIMDGGSMKILEELTRLGLKVGNEGKDTKNLNQQELATVLINSFIQHTASSKSQFSEGLTSEGTMSDRSKIDMFIMKLKNSQSTAPITKKNGLKILNELNLRERYFDTQNRSFSALQDNLVGTWKSVFTKISKGDITIKKYSVLDNLSLNVNIDRIKTIRDVYNVLQEHKFDYKDILQKTGLVDLLSLVKSNEGFATINYSMIQLSEVVLADIIEENTKYNKVEKTKRKENQEKKDFYLDMYYNEFMNYIRDVEYEISPREIAMLESRFDYLEKLEPEVKKEEAKKLALKIFFYNDSIFEQELIQFGMGNVFQYKTRVKSIFEETNKLKTQTPKTILKEIENFDFKDGITTKMSFDELKDRGIDGNAASSIKSILSSTMSDKDKVTIIEFMDTFAQISPQYVDRVKRNQASGTSGLGPVLAQTNKSGMLLDQDTQTITIEDPTRDAFTLNSGMQEVDIFDGSQLISPEYAYKLNNSIGDRFSNFRSTSFFKTVNASKTKDGVATYEKLAAFSSHTWEMLLYGTPEHHSLHQLMMRKEKFSHTKYSKDYTGLYLYKKSHIKNPENAKFIETLKGETIAEQIQELKKHGEYLDTLKVTTKDGANNIKASVLILDLAEGRIKESDIQMLHTNKTFKDSSQINSKLDLYNYYGGIQTNLDMYRANKSAKSRKLFQEEFPFGWVEKEIAMIMSNYRGTGVNYPIRNASINKINFVTTVKTGRQNVNPASLLKSKYIADKDVFTSSMSNEFLNIILNAEHNHDVTSEFDVNASQENTTIAMLTQVLSNSIAEGSTRIDVQKMNSALALLSNLQLEQLMNEISSYKLLAGRMNENGTAEKQYAVNLLRLIMEGRDDPGATLDALGITKEQAAEVSLDLRMLQPILRTSVNAEFSKRGIKLRFAGGQYVLSPITGQINLYNYGSSINLLRSTMFNTEDIDKIVKQNSMNGILKAEILSEEFTGELKDPTWKLRPINTVEALEAEHSTMDYVYRKVIDTAGTKYEAVIVQDLLSSGTTDLKNYVSPWMDQDTEVEPGAILPNGAHGKDLAWMNYFKDGIAFGESDEFMSFYLAGKAPKDLAKIVGASLEVKLEYFKRELSTPGYEVPKVLWTRFILDLKNNVKGDTDWVSFVNTLNINPKLISSKILSKGIIDSSYESFTNNLTSLDNFNSNKLFENFFNYIASHAGEERPLTNMMKSQMAYELDQDGWHVSEAEFFMPPHHQAAYLIEFGDSIQDMFGTQEQPNLPKMASIVGLTDIEVSLLGRYYIHSKGEGNEKMEVIKKKIEANRSPEALKYLELREQQQDHLKIYFKTKITNIKKSIKNATGSELTAIKLRAPLLILTEKSKNLKNSKDKQEFTKILDSLLKAKNVTSNLELFEFLMSIKTLTLDIKTNQETIHSDIKNKAKAFETEWIQTLSNNFEKSLTFLTARIPSQAKQQTALGKIVGFIYSTKNAIYSPIELIALGGADFDIDKQNNITWNVDSMGKIIPWDHLTDESGNLVLTTEINTINEDIIKFKEILGYASKDDEINLRKQNVFRQERMLALKYAAQNYIVQSLMVIAGSSKNAIETSTSVAMNKLGVIKDYIASYNFSELDIKEYNLKVDPETGRPIASPELFKLIKKRQIAIPYTPSTKMLFEKINMDGRVGISTFASAIKAYMAVFSAAVNNDSTSEFEDNLKAVLAKLGLEDLVSVKEPLDLKKIYTDANKGNISEDLQNIEFAKIDGKYIKPVWKDPETGLYEEGKELIYPANAEKFIPKLPEKDVYPLLHGALAKKVYIDLIHAKDDAQLEADIVLKYTESLNLHSDYSAESQAWQDFAELLSASTDNAKELILSVIGANNTTSSIIATMIAMGVDLKSALLIVNDDIIRKEVAEHEGDKSLVNNTKDFIKTFTIRLSDKIGNYNLKAPIKELKANIDKRNKNYNKEKINIELQKFGHAEVDIKVMKNPLRILNADQLTEQQALHKKYNPASQLFIFSKASAEFTLLSGILTINTGMVNSEEDTFNYLLKLERALKVGNKTGSLEEFLDPNNHTVREEMIRAGNKTETDAQGRIKGKIAFNIPYIIYNNKPFYEYIQSLFKANGMMQRLTYTTKILEETVKPLVKKAGKMRIESTDLYAYNTLLSNIALSTYYNKTGTVLHIPTLNKKEDKFDLTTVQGRLDFIKNIAQIKESLIAAHPDLVGMKFLDDILASDVRVNQETGKSLTLLAGINTEFLTESEKAGYKADLKRIKKISPKLYDVLSHYSLIVDKGGLSSSSIASLLGFKNIKKFNDHLVTLHNNDTMQKIVVNIDPDILGIALPMTLKELSTQKNVQNEEYLYKIEKKDIRTIDQSDEYMQFNQDVGEGQNEEHSMAEEEAMFDFMSQEAFEEHVRESKLALKFHVQNLNDIMESGDYMLQKSFISKTNGLTYHYFTGIRDNNEPYKSFIPVTKDVDGIVGNLDISEDTELKNSIVKLGYQYGWEIKLSDGAMGRLLSYTGKFNDYNVLINGRIITLTKDQITQDNPQFLLSSEAIIVKKGIFKKVKPAAVHWEVVQNYDDKSIITNRLLDTASVSSKVMYIGEHMTYHQGHELMTNDLRISENAINNLEKQILAYPKDKDASSLQDIQTDVRRGIINKMFAVILTNLDMTVNVEDRPDQKVKNLFEEMLSYTKNGVTESDDLNNHLIIKFMNELNLDENKHQLYTFLRKSYKEQLEQINSIMNNDVKLQSLYSEDERVFALLGLSEFKGTGKKYTFLNHEIPIKSDIEFLKEVSLDDVTIAQYQAILNKFGVTPDQYRAMLGDKMDLLTIEDKVYPRPDYLDLNQVIIDSSNTKFSLELNTKRSLKKEKEKVQMASPKVVSRLSAFLNKRFENSTIKVMTVSDVLEEYPEIDIKNNDQAFVNVGNSTIVLIQGRVTLDTFLHEMGHLYLAELKDKDLKLYQNLMVKIENDPITKAISEAYSDKINYTIEDILEEAFVFKLQEIHSADFASMFALEDTIQFDDILNNGKTKLGNISDSFTSLFEDFLGGKFKKGVTISLNDSMTEVMRKMGIDLIFNKNSTLHGMSRNDIANVKAILKDKQLTLGEAINILVEKGLMHKICN